jgi:preprotein translocase subunit SecA
VEGRNFEVRQTLWKYESVIENHRREVYGLRRTILLSPAWSVKSLLPEEHDFEPFQGVAHDVFESAGRRLALATIDDLWADYLANVAELRGGIHWVSWGGRDPLFEFLTGVEAIYADFHAYLVDEIAEALATAEIRDGAIRFLNEDRFERGSTWTYLTTDQPFGTLGERIMKGLRRKFSRP